MKKRIALRTLALLTLLVVIQGCAVQTIPAEIHSCAGPGEVGPEVKLLTYNIHFGVGTDGKPSLDKIREIIRPYDVVCLNEVNRHQAQALATALDMNWIATDRSRRGSNANNNAILTRRPIRGARIHQLPVFFLILWHRTVLEADLGDLHVFCAHTGLLPFERGNHLSNAEKILSACPGRRVLCGDLNTAPTWRAIRGLKAHYVDASPAGITHQTWPRLHIDYIFVSRDLEVVESHITPSDASDHLPVGTTLRSMP